jgi:hypothetical protein
MAVAGTAFGGIGPGFIGALALAGVLLGGVAGSLVAVRETGSGDQLVEAGLGSARLVLFVTFAVLACGTAGYIANEVFFHWFPNLLFSFVILAVAGVVHWLAGPRTLSLVQAVLAGAALLGVLALAAASLSPRSPDGPGDVVPFIPGLFAAALPLLVGFDLAGTAKRRRMWLALAVVIAVQALWGAASLEVVARERLVESTVPHMTAARKIMGWDGRSIMGGAMLAAVAAGLVALLRGVTSSARCVLALDPARRPFGITLAVCLAPAALLLLGFAGKAVTESLLRGALAFYFAVYALGCWRGLQTGRTNWAWTTLGLAACTFGAVVLAGSSREPLAALVIFGLAVVLAVVLRGVSPRAAGATTTNQFGRKPCTGS